MSYCIAFSVEGAKDVTRRYVRPPSDALLRNRMTEAELAYILEDLCGQRRANMEHDEREKLKLEDA